MNENVCDITAGFAYTCMYIETQIAGASSHTILEQRWLGKVDYFLP